MIKKHTYLHIGQRIYLATRKLAGTNKVYKDFDGQTWYRYEEQHKPWEINSLVVIGIKDITVHGEYDEEESYKSYCCDWYDANDENMHLAYYLFDDELEKTSNTKELFLTQEEAESFIQKKNADFFVQYTKKPILNVVQPTVKKAT